MKTRKIRNEDRTADTYTPSPAYNLSMGRLNTYSLQHHQCQELNEKYYLVLIDPYNNENLHNSLPIVTNLNELENGLYIYVLLSLDDNPPTIYCIKTYNLYELGTKHQQLIHRIACSNGECKKYVLYYAGELEKTQSSIIFNFYSGTFKMETKLKKRTIPNDIDFMRTNIISLLENPSLSVEYIDAPLITSNRTELQLTQTDLDFFKSLGAIIYVFDNKEKCKQYLLSAAVSPSKTKYELPSKMQIKITNDATLYGGKKSNKRVKSKKTKKYLKNKRYY